MLAPVIHTYKEVDLGGGAIFPAISFINGLTLQFPAGNWTISGGNLSTTINPVANCYVKQTQSAAYAVTSADGGGGTVDLTDIELKITELYKIHGLSVGSPMTVTQTSRTVDDISQEISGDGETTTTITRV